MTWRSTFLLLVILALFPTQLWAGTDDSGLQTFTLNATDMLGYSPSVGSEDTKYCDRSSHDMFISGNALSAIRYTYDLPIAGFTNSVILCATKAPRITTTSLITEPEYNSGFVSFFDGTYSRTMRLWPFTDVIGPNTGEVTHFNFWTSAVVSGNHNMYVCDAYHFSKYIIPATGGGFTDLTHVSSSPWDAGLVWDAAIWQGRMFVISRDGYAQNRLCYAAAGNPEDWTVGPLHGGIIELDGFSTCYRIFPTSYGLYVVRSDAVYILTGTGDPTSWSIQKVVDFNLACTESLKSMKNYVAMAGSSRNTIFLCSPASLYSLDGYTLTKIADLPYEGFRSKELQYVNDRYIVMLPYVYDMQTKSYLFWKDPYMVFSNTNILRRTYGSNVTYSIPGGGTASEVGTQTMEIGLTPPDYPTTSVSSYADTTNDYLYMSNWMTFDGNAGNFKELVRVEIDAALTTGEIAYMSVLVPHVTLPYAIGSSFYIRGVNRGAYYATRNQTTTFTWCPNFKQPFRRIKFYIGDVTTLAGIGSPGNIYIKQIRFYYRGVGNPKKVDVQ